MPDTVPACTILILEDDPIIAWDLQQKLQSIQGPYHVHVCADVSDAHNVIQEYEVKIIMTNLKLLNGWLHTDSIIYLQAVVDHLIILTGLADHPLHEVDWAQIDATFLYKPFNTHQLKTAIGHAA